MGKIGGSAGAPQNPDLDPIWTPMGFPWCLGPSGTFVGSQGQSLATSSSGDPLRFEDLLCTVLLFPCCNKKPFQGPDCVEMGWALLMVPKLQKKLLHLHPCTIGSEQKCSREKPRSRTRENPQKPDFWPQVGSVRGPKSLEGQQLSFASPFPRSKGSICSLFDGI